MRFIYLSPPTYLIFFSLLYFPVHRYCHFLSCLLFHVFLSAISFLVCCFMSSCLLFPFLQLHYHLTVISPLSYSLAITLITCLSFPFFPLLFSCHFLFPCVPFPVCFPAITLSLGCRFLAFFLAISFLLAYYFLSACLLFPSCLPAIFSTCLPFFLLVNHSDTLLPF